MKISLKQKNIIQSIVSGFLWIVAGIFSILATKNKSLNLGTAICCFAIIALWLIVTVVNAEEGDERSEYNLLRAHDSAFRISLLGLAVCLIIDAISSLFGIELIVHFKGWILMFLGIMNIISGISFYHYEKGE